MTGSVFSTLSGKLVGKHPELGVLVNDEGQILCPNKGYGRDNPNAKFHWTVGYLDSMGYRFILIKKKYYRIHRLVAETFIPNPEGKATVDHVNRNRSDNRISNLRWADMQEQSRNTKSYDAALDLGVRRHDNLKEWERRYMRRRRAIKRQDPEWVEQDPTKRREYMRKYMREYTRKKRQDPEYKAHRNELQRLRRAKKKAEQSAQPSI